MEGSASVKTEAMDTSGGSQLPPTRVRLPKTEGNEKPGVETLLSLWNQQQSYIDHLEASAEKTDSRSAGNCDNFFFQFSFFPKKEIKTDVQSMSICLVWIKSVVKKKS